ncbi:MAG: glycosyltransferase [Caldilineaceae bacterium]
MSSDWTGQALVIVPTYNEKENLAKLVGRLRALPGDVHVLVVDDNSPDGTGDIADGMAATDPGVHVLHRSGKLGLGTAYRTGFRYGLDRTTIATSAPWTPTSATAPKASPICWTRRQAATIWWWAVATSCGAVVGSTAFRKFISYGANWLAHVLLGVSIHDCTAGFRCYHRRDPRND